MSAAAAAKRKWTVAEYLAMEAESQEKHEFFDGEIFLMPGGTPEHNQISANVLAALIHALGDTCNVYSSDMRLYIPQTGLFCYADASVLCGDPDLMTEGTPPPSLKNPMAIVEVLSDSTEKYDRGTKFENYRSIPALQHYVLVSQGKVLIEQFTRQPDGAWLLREVRAGQKLCLPWGEICLRDVYRKVLPGPF